MATRTGAARAIVPGRSVGVAGLTFAKAARTNKRDTGVRIDAGQVSGDIQKTEAAPPMRLLGR